MPLRSKKIKSGVKKIDKVVTGIIIGSAIASIFGLKKTKKGKEITKNITSGGKKIHQKIFKIFGKIIAFIVGIFSKK